MTETSTFRDFTRKRARIHFTIDDQEFEARKGLTPARLQAAVINFKSSQSGADVSLENVLEKLSTALKLVLKEESYQRFMALMDDEDRDEPLDLPQLTEIFEWLIEQYTQRPTEALSDSLISLEIGNAGTDSPAGVLHLESTP